MHLWTPSRDEPELLGWWSALLMVARLARDECVPWPVHIDEFDLLGRVDRGGQRQPIWVYRHRGSGGDIYADATGQTYRYRPTPNAAAAGRFNRCELRTSIHFAGLPEVVEPVFYEEPPHRSSWTDAAADPESFEAHPSAQGRSAHRRARPRVPKRNRWLHLVPTVSA
jgi:hypothetical protein